MLARFRNQERMTSKEIFRLLFDSAEIANFAPEEKAKYEQNMTTERDIRNQIAYAREKGLEEGLEEGMKEGMEKGMEKAFRLMAEQLRKMGLHEDDIAKAVSEAMKS